MLNDRCHSPFVVVSSRAAGVKGKRATVDSEMTHNMYNSVVKEGIEKRYRRMENDCTSNSRVVNSLVK